MTAPYWTDGTVSLYLGDYREILPALEVTADLVLADPPYGETSLAWDRWPHGWLNTVADATSSLWCFGSMRMFGERWPEFGAANWQPSQDIIGVDEDGAPVYGDVHVVWEKHNGSGFAADRFKRVHEHATHWYRGEWRDVQHETPREAGAPRARTIYRSRNGTTHTGKINGAVSQQDGTRLLRSVIRVSSMQGRALHPTEKPIGILDPLIRYACPPGGLVIDPFAGSGSTLDAARQSGRRAIGIEAHEPYAEKAARRLDQLTLDIA